LQRRRGSLLMLSNKKIPYGKQSISWWDIWEVVKTLRSNNLTQGPKIKEFEDALCAYTGAKYAVALSNGTAALHLATLALDIKEGDEGITTPITFIASANSMLYAGGSITFADIEKSTANIDPKEIKKKIGPRTKVLIPVHFAGQSCDMEAIAQIAKEHNLFVIEDAAHAIGSHYKDTMVGSCRYSDMTIFSFHPVKTMTTGEGGAITTNNKELYEKLLTLRTIGVTRDPARLTQNDGPWFYQMHDLGFNYRMTDMQAALGISQLRRLDSFAQRRREIVESYRAAFANDERFALLEEKDFSYAAFHLCPLLINFNVVKTSKPELFEKLKTRGLYLQVHYIPVHTQPYYKKLGFNDGDYPVAEQYYRSTLSLPLYPLLKDREVKDIIQIIKDVVR